ncbi:MAG: radical SAM protein, partial [Smithella sp.]
MIKDFIDDTKIENLLIKAKNPTPQRVREIITKSLELKGLSPEEVAVLLQTEDDELIGMILQAAHKIKEDIYGNRLVLFAPLYIANHCANNCLYCGFRRDNKELNRVALTMEQITKEVQVLEREGHKRLLMLCGEHPTRSSLEYFMEAIETAYSIKTEKGGEIRRINVEIAPLEVAEYKELKKTGIGTVVLFQETYHHETYKIMHPS